MFNTDSVEYHLLTEAVLMTKDVEGATCEIGLREGGGSWYMMEALITSEQNTKKPHITIDPYGSIEYKTDGGGGGLHALTRYSNSMRNNTLSKMYAYAEERGIDYHHFNMEDTEFFNRYYNGIPIYNNEKYFINKYSVVHFDGAHNFQAVLNEVMFFHARTDFGAVFVFDDVNGWYAHDLVHHVLEKLGWRSCLNGEMKLAYIKSHEVI